MLYLPSAKDYNKVEENSFIHMGDHSCLSMERGTMYSSRFLECSELIYVTSGTLPLKIENQEYVIEKGELLLMPMYRNVCGLRKTEDKLCFWTLEFSCSESMTADITEKIISLREDATLMHELLAVLSRDTGEKRDNSLRDATMIMVLQIARENARLNMREARSENHTMSAIVDYINGNLSEMITVENIASHFGYSKDHIMKLFKIKYGVTMKKFINDRKLSTARRLLVTTDMSIDKISQAIGMESPELFQKYFKYHEKITPQRYRQINK